MFLARNTWLDGPVTVDAFTLAHLSDPHLAPLPKPRLSELMGKRATGYFNWVRNRHLIHSRPMLDKLTADLRAQHPDHIAVTGDLVNIALEAEFGPARDWLKTIGAPHDVTLVPGNHDAYVASTWPRCADQWLDYMRGDDATDAAHARFPYLRRRGPLLLIGVSTAVPTAPFMATGRLGQKQIADLAALLAQHASDDCFRVLLIHHPLALAGFAASQAADRCACAARRAAQPWRAADPARARSQAFADVVRRPFQAKFQRSACRLHLPPSTASTMPPPTICFASKIKAVPGAATGLCAALAPRRPPSSSCGSRNCLIPDRSRPF